MPRTRSVILTCCIFKGVPDFRSMNCDFWCSSGVCRCLTCMMFIYLFVSITQGLFYAFQRKLGVDSKELTIHIKTQYKVRQNFKMITKNTRRRKRVSQVKKRKIKPHRCYGSPIFSCPNLDFFVPRNKKSHNFRTLCSCP